MADSPNPATSQTDIDNLVKELSRPQGVPPAPSSPTSSAPVQPAMPTRPMTPPTPTSAAPQMPPKPAPIAPPAPSAAPKPPTPPTVPAPAPSAPKEYQSSIRTMTDDLAKLKAGQQPQGVNIPRKVEPAAPAVPPKPATPPAAAPKPAAPSVTMPSAAKSAPLPASPAPAKPAPAPTTPPPSIPRPSAPASVTMPAPAKAPELKPDQKNAFYVPPADTSAKAGKSSNNLLWLIILLVVVALGGAYWYFMIRDSGTDTAIESPVVTFTPRPTPTPIVDVLGSIFPNKGGVIVLPAAGDPSSAFTTALSAQPNIIPGEFTAVDLVSGASPSAQTLTVTGLFDRFVATYPAEFKAALGTHYKFLVYGQKEAFDAKGKPLTASAPGNRLVIVSEIASSSATILQNWETTMSTNLAGVMSINPAKNKGAVMTTSYNGISIRFKNFPYPDHSIDYTILQYGNQTYLIMAGSREAMFASVDAFKVPGK